CAPTPSTSSRDTPRPDRSHRNGSADTHHPADIRPSRRNPWRRPAPECHRTSDPKPRTRSTAEPPTKSGSQPSPTPTPNPQLATLLRPRPVPHGGSPPALAPSHSHPQQVHTR